MTTLITAILATTAGLSWNWATGNQPMSYWLMGGFYFGSTMTAELIEWAWDRHRDRRRIARRAKLAASWRSQPTTSRRRTT